MISKYYDTWVILVFFAVSYQISAIAVLQDVLNNIAYYI